MDCIRLVRNTPGSRYGIPRMLPDIPVSAPVSDAVSDRFQTSGFRPGFKAVSARLKPKAGFRPNIHIFRNLHFLEELGFRRVHYSICSIPVFRMQ